MDTTGGTDDDLRAIGQGLHVLADIGTTDTGVAVDVHEVTDGDNDLLDLLSQLTGRGQDEGLARLEIGVDLLEGGDREGSGLTGTGLGLGDDVGAWDGLLEIFLFDDFVLEGRGMCGVKLTLDDGHDGTLLDSRRALETVGIDTWMWMLDMCHCRFSLFLSLLHLHLHCRTEFCCQIHTTKQLRLEVHSIERVGNLIVVRLNLSCKVGREAELARHIQR